MNREMRSACVKAALGDLMDCVKALSNQWPVGSPSPPWSREWEWYWDKVRHDNPNYRLFDPYTGERPDTANPAVRKQLQLRQQQDMQRGRPITRVNFGNLPRTGFGTRPRRFGG